MKILLLDLDGTVREPISDNKFINKPDDQKLINGVTEAFASYRGWHRIGITNQGGVASGFKTLEDAIAEQQRTLELIWLDAILFCPDMAGKSCWVVEPMINEPYCVTMPRVDFRKPMPGMLLFARRLAWNWNGSHATDGVDQSLYVGDRPEDEQAALAANIPFMWAEDWRKQ